MVRTKKQLIEAYLDIENKMMYMVSKYEAKLDKINERINKISNK